MYINLRKNKMYNTLLSYGDVIPLKLRCNVEKLFKETEQFPYAQYNPRKNIKRNGLSITSLDGNINGVDLDSIREYNLENGTRYDEDSFRTLTDVYHSSKEIQKIVDPFAEHIVRSHILHLCPGGYFPPHRDQPVYKPTQKSIRILVPLKNCNPPDMYFMYENRPLHFNHGQAIFLNTNKMHALFSYRDSYMIVLNVLANEQVYETIGKLFGSV